MLPVFLDRKIISAEVMARTIKNLRIFIYVCAGLSLKCKYEFNMNWEFQIGKIHFTSEKPVLLSGPCVVESKTLCEDVAGTMKEMTSSLGFQYIFKASFDKANRTSVSSFRSLGFDTSLQILKHIRDSFELPVVTDVHETIQVDEVAEVADVLQIPAFLSRQTDLLVKAGESGATVNVKKGQFMAPEDISYACEKIRGTGNKKVFVTERGTSFGYHNLVVDMRSLPVMRTFAPVIFDVTHSVQRPGGLGGKSGGNREYTPYLARAAAAAGVDGFFIETHPEPDNAYSDGPNMIPLSKMESFLNMIAEIWHQGQKYRDFKV